MDRAGNRNNCLAVWLSQTIALQGGLVTYARIGELLLDIFVFL